MRTMLRIQIPTESGNRSVEDGGLPRAMGAFLEKYKPEAAYFFPEDGRRAALFVFDLESSSDIPSVAEHFFFSLGASVQLTPVMNADDLKAGLEKSMKARSKG